MSGDSSSMLLVTDPLLQHDIAEAISDYWRDIAPHTRVSLTGDVFSVASIEGKLPGVITPKQEAAKFISLIAMAGGTVQQLRDAFLKSKNAAKLLVPPLSESLSETHGSERLQSLPEAAKMEIARVIATHWRAIAVGYGYRVPDVLAQLPGAPPAVDFAKKFIEVISNAGASADDLLAGATAAGCAELVSSLLPKSNKRAKIESVVAADAKRTEIESADGQWIETPHMKMLKADYVRLTEAVENKRTALLDPAQRAATAASLSVEVVNDKVLRWDKDRRCNLTYKFRSETFGPQAEACRSALKRAAEDWHNAADVQFIELSLEASDDPFFEVVFDEHAYEKSCTGREGYACVAQGTLMYSFQCSYPAEFRKLVVCPGYNAGGYELVGLFRHELGHILGLTHEHVWFGFDEQYQSSSVVISEQADKDSVMMYKHLLVELPPNHPAKLPPKADDELYSLTLSEDDIKAVQRLYSMSSRRTSDCN